MKLDGDGESTTESAYDTKGEVSYMYVKDGRCALAPFSKSPVLNAPRLASSRLAPGPIKCQPLGRRGSAGFGRPHQYHLRVLTSM